MSGGVPAVARTLDLRGVACPLNYVKTRVALDRLAPGEALEVWLDLGEPTENVPRSCDEDGYTVVALEEVPAGIPHAAGTAFTRLVVTAAVAT
ncbi:MAG TPA: sulfurtransferase TusA family protein [Candidatus Dormibacteraeota bacterium]|nr:sulfurtransferase TusA family protein [Candidatus Dormibacteraeota bacterium]